MITAKTWELSNVLTVTVKSSEKCPVYLLFTSKKGQQYGKAVRHICMFPQTWTGLKKLEPVLVESDWEETPVEVSWSLPSFWQVEVREFKENKYVCFSQWEGETRIPKFNMTIEEHRVLLEISGEIDAVIKDMRAERQALSN